MQENEDFAGFSLYLLVILASAAILLIISKRKRRSHHNYKLFPEELQRQTATNTLIALNFLEKRGKT